jgi:hypothetical protein
MPQGVEIRKERSTGLSPFGKKDDASEHYKFAVVQCSMLKDSLHDAATTISCLRAINEVLFIRGFFVLLHLFPGSRQKYF